jgi:hypothetical protein
MSQSRCPYCDRAIPVPAVLKAVLPSAIRCPNCARRVRVKNVGLLSAAYVVALATVVCLLFYAHRLHFMSSGQRLIAGIALVFAVEFAASLFVARIGRFEKWEEDT